MVDPNKLTLLTPGIDRRTGEYLDFGLPATVLANYLRDQRIVNEKCDLNSILFLLTPGRGREQAQHSDRQTRQSSRISGTAMHPSPRSCRLSIARTLIVMPATH